MAFNKNATYVLQKIIRIIPDYERLNELKEAIKEIVQEATEEIKRLSEQLEDFQRR